MKTYKSKISSQLMFLLGALFLITLNSCKDEVEPVPDPIASFQFAISQTNFREVTFTNFSQNAVSYNWTFGDGESSTDQSPTHVYAEFGKYTVKLIATNSDGVTHSFEQEIEVKDPFEALTLLAGETSKTWRLFRVGTSMGVGPNVGDPRGWWSLENDGSRPCVYFHEFTFNREGKFIFDDKGSFWGEEAVFGDGLKATCFAAEASNMVNSEGASVSAWLSGTHAFEYNTTTNMVTLTGLGAWMGLPQLTTTGDQKTPVTSKSFKITIEEKDGYDLMIVLYEFADLVWEFSYASYSNPALEPEVKTTAAPWGEDLDNITPTAIKVTFASRNPADLVTIDTVTSASTVDFGVDDPLDGTAAKVGKFNRIPGIQYQELQFQVYPDPKDIQFDNFTVAKIDIYIPDNTVFTTLVRHFVFGFADKSATKEWWNSPVQFVKEGNDVVLGAWTTYTFNLTDVKARQDLDMIYLGMGGGGHETGGTFYVRNLIFE